MAIQFYLIEPKYIDGSSFNGSHALTPTSILIWRVALFKDQPSTTSILLPEEILVKALDTLFPQLSTSYPTGPTSDQIRQCLSNPSTYTLFLAIDLAKHPSTSATTSIPSPPSEAILGALTLVTLNLLKTSRAHIEDLIVSSDARGLGLGRALMVRALDEAVQVHSCSMVDLTSKPDRIQARRLYESLGFTIRDTGAFRYYAPNN